MDRCDIIPSLMEKFITEMCEHNRELEILKLCSFAFSRPVMEHLANFVLANFSLKKINLSWSEIISEDLLMFLNKIRNIKHIQEIDISAVPIEGHYTKNVLESLKTLIIGNPSLIHLNVSSCNLLDDQLDILIEGVSKSKSLVAVHLSGNFIKPETKDRLLQRLIKPNNIGTEYKVLFNV
jgi:Ran GTPase-activating protein (RanGAP) involved in mRNA processing and transport